MRIGTKLAVASAFALMLPGLAVAQSGPYVGAYGTFAIPRDISAETENASPATETETSLNLGFGGGVTFGYQYKSFRLEAEGIYWQAEADQQDSVTSGVTTSSTANFDVDYIGGMANFIVDIPLDGNFMADPKPGFRPYVGGGIGYGELDDESAKYDGFAYQGIAGVGYHLNNGLNFFLDYRYTGISLDDRTVSGVTESFDDHGVHRINLGLRYTFGLSGGGAQSAGSSFPSGSGLDQTAAMPMGMPGPAGLPPTDMAADPMSGARADAMASSRSGAPLMGAPGALEPMAPAGMAPLRPARAAAAPAFADDFTPRAGSGRYGVQVGAFRSNSEANAAWPSKQSQYGSLIAGTKPRVVAANVKGKGRWHRLYASGLSKSDADRVCRSIKSRGEYCAVAAL